MKYGVWVISHLKTSMEERYVLSYVYTVLSRVNNVERRVSNAV